MAGRIRDQQAGEALKVHEIISGGPPMSVAALDGDSSALHAQCARELGAGLLTLPDKPDEGPEATLQALWRAAAGKPVPVRRALEGALPNLDREGRQRLRGLVRARLGGTPLAHLVGLEDFMGVEFLASAEALIPRRETELLGFAALARLRTILERRTEALVVDVCTGCGNLALALAAHEPRCRVYGSDLDAAAVALARRNAQHLALEDRVSFREGDLLQPFDEPAIRGRTDLLLCNPPYISSAKVDTMPGEISGHEPRLAFDGGPFGIRILHRIVNEAPGFLVPGGWLGIEVGLGQGPATARRMQSRGYTEVIPVCDGNGAIRALLACAGTNATPAPGTD
jgi:release factor glutamine methyltransferase